MAIAIRTPRLVSVPVETYGTVAGRGYKVSKAVVPLLTRRGWTHHGEGDSYAYCKPPDGGRRPFHIDIEIPDREQVEDLARSRHEAGVPWVGLVGELPAFYTPSRAVTTTEVNPFAGVRGASVQAQAVPPMLQVGLTLLWSATVRFEDSGPVSHYDDSASPPPVQATLF